MPYLTTRKKPKATTKPWFSRLLRHPARKRNGSILVHNTHPGPTRGSDTRNDKCSVSWRQACETVSLRLLFHVYYNNVEFSWSNTPKYTAVVIGAFIDMLHICDIYYAYNGTSNWLSAHGRPRVLSHTHAYIMKQCFSVGDTNCQSINMANALSHWEVTGVTFVLHVSCWHWHRLSLIIIALITTLMTSISFHWHEHSTGSQSFIQYARELSWY